MCGIAGYAGVRTYDRSVIQGMTDRIRHRGPDAQDSFVEGGVGLGFVRLSIIDLSEAGTQPMFNEDERLALLFNGEIYNYQALKEELLKCGHIFKTKTDSEVLLHGYEEYGEGLLQKLRGMFTFVIYDREKKKFFGARDHFGIKPFYYYKVGDTFLFGSEIKAFLAHPDFKKELFEEKLPDFMTFGCIPGEETFFKNVYKLLPGHYFTYEKGKLKVAAYWEPTFKIDPSKTIESIADELDGVIEDSVDKHIIADVPVCSFLSSGVDSSYVANELKDKVDLTTFTIDFVEEKYSEAPHAKEFADEIGVENIARKVSAEEYFRDAKLIQYYMDEPLANPSANLLYYIANRVSKDFKVALSGEGADEMFGGYNIYHENISLGGYQKLPRFIRKALAAVVKPLPDFKGKGFIIRGSKTVEERYIGNSNVFKYGERDAFLKKKYPSRNPLDIANEFYQKVPGLDDVSKMQYLDFNMWLRQEILLKADKMSMANSLELRVPFMDVEVFKTARTIPSSCKVNKENTKLAFRALADRKISAKSAKRKKLMFPSPLPDWMRRDEYYNLIKDQFRGETAARFFNQEKILGLLEEHKQGHVTHAIQIWVVYTFLVWYEAYFIDN